MMSALWVGVVISLGTSSISNNASPVSIGLIHPYTDTVVGLSTTKGSEVCDVTPSTDVSEISWQITSQQMLFQIQRLPEHRGKRSSPLWAFAQPEERTVILAGRNCDWTVSSGKTVPLTNDITLPAHADCWQNVVVVQCHGSVSLSCRPVRWEQQSLGGYGGRHRSQPINQTTNGRLHSRAAGGSQSDKKGVRSTVALNLEEGRNMTGISDILERMIGNSQCWSLLLDLTNDADIVLRFVGKSNLYFWPTVRVFVVGSKGNMNVFLRNASLRNALRTYYLSLDERTITAIRSLSYGPRSNNSTPVSDFATKLARNRVNFSDGVVEGRAEIYFRCIYCEKGNPGVRKLLQWNLAETLSPVPDFPDETINFNGHQFNIVCKKRIPLTDVDKNWGGPAGTVGPLDSLDVRINNAVSRKLNFTYLLREPWDDEWGLLGPGGNFSGIVGTLQYEKADFSFMLTATPGRSRVMDYSRVYAGDPFVIVSLKPQALPRYLAIVRPFTSKRFTLLSGNRFHHLSRPIVWVWNSVLISCLFTGVVLWLIEKIRWSFSGAKAMSLSNSLLYTVRMVLINPPEILPTHLASQVRLTTTIWKNTIELFNQNKICLTHYRLILKSVNIPYEMIQVILLILFFFQFLFGIWSVASLVIVIGYQSALIAHLTVVVRSSAINTFDDLYKREGQKWGWIEYSGTAIAYVSENPDPIVQEIYKKLEIHPLGAQMDLILAGHYSHVTRKTIVWVDFLKAERRGLPVYMSTTEYPVFGGYGWGFRKGAPFRDAIDKMKQRLIEAGLIDRWLNEVIKVQVEVSERKEFNGTLITRQANEKEQRALSLENLQGSFYLLIIGYWIAVLVLLLEITRRYYTR
ncbi:uncharacterized protein LOC135220338 [Macrobrachium nipponense]|uniref:uncharacterized protein LOC135220338 n=1 Tax=Macrobrachium nipponense TaxID=159736 RepID=UPI0030C85944